MKCFLAYSVKRRYLSFERRTFIPLVSKASGEVSYLTFFFVTFFSLPLKHPSTNKKTPNVMNGTCRAAQRPEQVSKAKLLLRQTPADIPACQLSLLPSPGVTSPQYLTQGDPSASSTRSLSSGLSCILSSGGFSCLNFLQEHLLSVFLAAPAHSGSWITTPGSYSQPGRLESCWTWNTPVSKLTQSLWQSRHPWFPETLI